MKPSGLKNIGLSCYANAVTQCLRACISGINVDTSLITGETEDAREYYISYVDKLPYRIKSQFNIKYKDGSSSTYAILSNKLNNNIGKIDKYNNFIVVYVCPNEQTLQPVTRKIQDIYSLKICESGSSKILDQFKLVAGICLSSGHYYSLVYQDDKWYLCNDQHISILNSTTNEYPFYMLFYSKIEKL